MDKTEEELKPGVIVRDISSEYDGQTFDVLFINDTGVCRYSNDVFDTEQEAALLAERCTEALVDSEAWDYYQHSEGYSDDWKIAKRIERKAA
ncbi:hypothetical protein VU677_06625 [Hafnia paralvei]|uniref:hypothetical protein n=1 Tax=Hafnia paralvei TaxID=546367 RepID=UPI003CFB7F77